MSATSQYAIWSSKAYQSELGFTWQYDEQLGHKLMGQHPQQNTNEAALCPSLDWPLVPYMRVGTCDTQTPTVTLVAVGTSRAFKKTLAAPVSERWTVPRPQNG